MTVQCLYKALIDTFKDVSAMRESFEYCLWLHHYSRGVARSLGSAVWLARLHVIRVAEDNEAVSQ